MLHNATFLGVGMAGGGGGGGSSNEGLHLQVT